MRVERRYLSSTQVSKDQPFNPIKQDSEFHPFSGVPSFLHTHTYLLTFISHLPLVLSHLPTHHPHLLHTTPTHTQSRRESCASFVTASLTTDTFGTVSSENKEVVRVIITRGIDGAFPQVNIRVSLRARVCVCVCVLVTALCDYYDRDRISNDPTKQPYIHTSIQPTNQPHIQPTDLGRSYPRGQGYASRGRQRPGRCLGNW